MRTFFAFMLALLAALAPARAASWKDPNFDEAFKTYELIVVAKITKAAPTETQVEIVRVLAGEVKPGDAVTILRAPAEAQLEAFPSPTVGSTRLIVARKHPQEAGKYAASSDTYWSFEVEADRAFLPIRDPFTRAHVAVADLEVLIRHLRGSDKAAAEAFADEMAKRLATVPAQTDVVAELETQLFTLEVLHLTGSAKQFDAALPLLKSSHLQVRWSCARALRTTGGEKAVAPLLEALKTEKAPQVQTAIGYALVQLAPKTGREVLLQVIPTASSESLRLGRGLMPTVANTLPAPRAMLIAALMKMDGQAGGVTELLAKAEEYWKSVAGGPEKK